MALACECLGCHRQIYGYSSAEQWPDIHQEHCICLPRPGNYSETHSCQPFWEPKWAGLWQIFRLQVKENTICLCWNGTEKPVHIWTIKPIWRHSNLGICGKCTLWKCKNMRKNPYFKALYTVMGVSFKPRVSHGCITYGFSPPSTITSL